MLWIAKLGFHFTPGQGLHETMAILWGCGIKRTAYYPFQCVTIIGLFAGAVGAQPNIRLSPGIHVQAVPKYVYESTGSLFYVFQIPPITKHNFSDFRAYQFADFSLIAHHEKLNAETLAIFAQAIPTVDQPLLDRTAALDFLASASNCRYATTRPCTKFRTFKRQTPTWQTE